MYKELFLAQTAYLQMTEGIATENKEVVDFVLLLHVLGKIYFVEVISSKRCSTLWTLSQTRIVSTSNTLGAKDVEALGQNCVFLTSRATRTVELGLFSVRA